MRVGATLLTPQSTIIQIMRSPHIMIWLFLTQIATFCLLHFISIWNKHIPVVEVFATTANIDSEDKKSPDNSSLLIELFESIWWLMDVADIDSVI